MAEESFHSEVNKASKRVECKRPNSSTVIFLVYR